MWQASSLFFTVLQFSFEDYREKDEEYATIFTARKPSIIAPLKNMPQTPGDIRHHSQSMSNEHRSRSSLIGELATHLKNWLPISFDIRGPQRTGWRAQTKGPMINLHYLRIFFPCVDINEFWITFWKYFKVEMW